MSGMQSTRLASNAQTPPRVVRPTAATPSVPRSGSREIANVGSDGLIAAGKVTTGGQPVTLPKPAGSGSAGGEYTRRVTGNG
jgi:hypothetical protein